MISLFLAMTIRFLAGGAHQDIYGHYGVGCSTFYDNLWLSIDAIDSIAEFAICFPYDDASKLRDMKVGWAARSTEFAVRGCVAALDGIIVKTVKPPRFLEFRDANGLGKRIRIQQARYLQPRKCCYGLNVQVMCDAKYRITYIYKSTWFQSRFACIPSLRTWADSQETWASRALFYRCR
jgi:hypothetical protein